jgi:uncharacterized OB-fold protein
MAGQPIPRRSPETEFFWTAGADGVLRMLRCRDCDRLTHPPVPRCRQCGSSAVEPADLSGDAIVWSYSVVHQPFVPWIETPYVLGIVEIAEDRDVHLTTRLVDVGPDAVEIGMPVHVCFEQQEWAWLPLFRASLVADGG